ncbi:hypothetical protein AB0C59_21325 [Streptomyces sp. NPDC048664]|uniref:hypothetical protein n=1 Tax=Streptomyces sp. NPDC048664 TaxID=3154505 RepID=UPI00344AF87F
MHISRTRSASHTHGGVLRGAAIAATVAMALGAAAPLAEASEAQNSASSVSQPAAAAAAAAKAASESSDMKFTAAEVRDLVKQMKADGASPAETEQFELYAASLESGAHPGSSFLGMGTIVRKLIIAAFRHGGTWLGKVLKHVHPKSAKYAGKYGGKIADAIESVEGWGEHALVIALVRAGVPTDVAKDLAMAIMLVAF